MQNNKSLSGAKKGAGSGSGGEAENSLRSKSYARVLDAISEGEIVGLVKGEQSIYLNDTPLMNSDGSYNFKAIKVWMRAGTQGQEHIEGVPSVENEVNVSVQVKKDVSVTRMVTNPNVDAARVKLRIPSLVLTDTDKGSVGPTSVKIQLQLKSANESDFTTVIEDTIEGKTTSAYDRQYRIELTGAAPWQIRMVRLTDDSTTDTLKNETWFGSMTEIIDAKFNYPNTAIIGLRVDAEEFDSVPTRAYHIRGVKIQVPSNYDPEKRTYDGSWDGTFKIAYSNNPAWCFYDLLTNDRYGVSRSVESIDKWSLYTIAKYCDEPVSDGKGGTEPRFAMNLYLQSREDAYKVLNDMASAFQAVLHYSAGSIVAIQDRPSDPKHLFTNANVIDGDFNYSTTSAKARHTVALVTWNDLSDMGKQKVEYVEDSEGIAKYGVVQTEVAAFGCTSQGQAQRVGRLLLETEQNQIESVTFSSGMEGVTLAPGDTLRIRDNYRNGERVAGRVLSWDAGTQRVTLDSDPGALTKLSVMLPNGQIFDSNVTRADGSTMRLMSKPPVDIQEMAIWIATTASETSGTKDYRVVSIKESTTPGILDISGIEYNHDKYNRGDNPIIGGDQGETPGEPGEGGGPTAPNPKRPDTPIGLKAVVNDTVLANAVQYSILASWDTPLNPEEVAFWRLQHEAPDGTVTVVDEIKQASVDLGMVQPGYHSIQVRAVGTNGLVSAAARVDSVYVGSRVDGPDGSAAVFKWASAVSGLLQIRVSWALSIDPALLKGIEIWSTYDYWTKETTDPKTGATIPPEHITFGDPELLATVAGSDIYFDHQNLVLGATMRYRLRAVGVDGLKSGFYPPDRSLEAEVSGDVGGLIDLINRDLFDSELWKKLKEGIDVNVDDKIREVLGGDISEYIGDKLDYINDEISDVRKKLNHSGEVAMREVIVNQELNDTVTGGFARVGEEFTIVRDGLALEANHRIELESRVGDAEAMVVQEQTARAEQGAALARTIETLDAKVGDNYAQFTAEKEVTATRDQVTASKIDAFDLKYEGEIATTKALISDSMDAVANDLGVVVNRLDAVVLSFEDEKTRVDAAISSESDVRALKDGALSSRIDVMTANFEDGLSKANADIVANKATAARETEALATSMEAMRVSFNNGLNSAAASILAEKKIAADATRAVASDLTTWSSSFDRTVSSVQQSVNTLATRTGKVEAQYFIKMNVNGYASGFGMSNDGSSASFLIQADKFSLGSAGVGNYSPFTVYTSNQSVSDGNGGFVTIGPGVYMSAAYMTLGTITTGHIADLTIARGKVGNYAMSFMASSAAGNGSVTGSGTNQEYSAYMANYPKGAGFWIAQVTVNLPVTPVAVTVTCNMLYQNGTVYSYSGEAGYSQNNETDWQIALYCNNVRHRIIKPEFAPLNAYWGSGAEMMAFDYTYTDISQGAGTRTYYLVLIPPRRNAGSSLYPFKWSGQSITIHAAYK